jgi:hypothetical protein
MVTSSALMGALLRIIHPELYAAGIQALTTLASHPELVKEGDELAAILQVWSSPYSTCRVKANTACGKYKSFSKHLFKINIETLYNQNLAQKFD